MCARGLSWLFDNFIWNNRTTLQKHMPARVLESGHTLAWIKTFWSLCSLFSFFCMDSRACTSLLLASLVKITQANNYKSTRNANFYHLIFNLWQRVTVLCTCRGLFALLQHMAKATSKKFLTVLVIFKSSWKWKIKKSYLPLHYTVHYKTDLARFVLLTLPHGHERPTLPAYASC